MSASEHNTTRAIELANLDPVASAFDTAIAKLNDAAAEYRSAAASMRAAATSMRAATDRIAAAATAATAAPPSATTACDGRGVRVTVLRLFHKRPHGYSIRIHWMIFSTMLVYTVGVMTLGVLGSLRAWQYGSDEWLVPLTIAYLVHMQMWWQTTTYVLAKPIKRT